MESTSYEAYKTHSLKYQNFLVNRGTQSFWLTYYVSYPVGAALALLAARCKISPNTLSILSFLAGVGGVTSVLALPLDHILEGIFLFFVLQLSYALDCADGVLARTTKTGSPFGLIFDKVIDQAGAAGVLTVLCVGSMQIHPAWLPTEALMAIFGFTLLTRSTFNTTTWLKESVMHGTDRLRVDQRTKSLSWLLRRFIGNFLDDPFYRFCLALFWTIGIYWEFLLAYSLFQFVILILFLLATKKDMEAQPKTTSPQP